MKSAKFLVATAAIAGMALTASPATAEWQWVDEGNTTVETRVYEEQAPSSYYDQQPRQIYREEVRRYEEPRPVYVTNTESFWDGDCQVHRTFMSDGSTSDERICERTRLMLPHRFIIDRIGRHIDNLRGYRDPRY